MNTYEIKTILSESLSNVDGKVRGWIRSVRKSKKFSFIHLNDGSCQQNFQIIIDADLENYEEVKSLLTGSSVEIEGRLVTSGGKGQSIEMQGKKVTIFSKTDESYPLQKKATSLEFLRENAHIRGRTNLYGAIFRIRHVMSLATHQFFDQKGFYYLHTPILTGVDAEGAGEMFNVTTLNLEGLSRSGKAPDYSQDFFGKQASLCVTGQLEAECYALSLGKVYTFGPTFRAENSNTPRHLSEFWMIEPEVAFADLDDVAELATDYVQYLIKSVLERCEAELDFLMKRPGADIDEGHLETLKNVSECEFKKITYTEAIDILNNSEKKFEFPTTWGSELQTEHERFLATEHFKSPVIVTDYPKDFKAFYMKQNDDGKTVRAMDVLVPGMGELIGGSQREDDLEKLTKRMDEMGMHKEPLWWYLDLRKHGSVKHAGFGLGFERAICYITGMKNLRDVIPFPRTPKSLDF
ncbi:MAG: asparagine--tRNA ligase [Bacteriovoracaceae bacterium]